jgi:transcriptional regulator with XRE-family HTH domain
MALTEAASAMRPFDVRRNIAAVVKLLMRLRDESQQELAPAIHMSPSSLSRALNAQRAWTDEDLAHLASHFGVSPATFFRPVEDLEGELLAPVQNWKILNQLTTVEHFGQLEFAFNDPPQLELV